VQFAVQLVVVGALGLELACLSVAGLRPGILRGMGLTWQACRLPSRSAAIPPDVIPAQAETTPTRPAVPEAAARWARFTLRRA